MLSIGEFSRASRLTIKTIRLYHEKGILVPARVDPETGYRYYDPASLERARVILELRGLEFSLGEIGEILATSEDDADIVSLLKRQRDRIGSRLRHLGEIRRAIEAILQKEKEAAMAARQPTGEILEKELDSTWIAGIRIRGKYSDCGPLFGKLGRAVGRHIRGKPFNLYYDAEYREEDADLETCFPVRAGCSAEGVSVRELPGCPCVSILHRGPYEELGRSYAALFEYLESHGLKAMVPIREVYIKGPGWIFRGNPRKYITEIPIPVERREAAT